MQVIKPMFTMICVSFTYLLGQHLWAVPRIWYIVFFSQTSNSVLIPWSIWPKMSPCNAASSNLIKWSMACNVPSLSPLQSASRRVRTRNELTKSLHCSKSHYQLFSSSVYSALQSMHPYIHLGKSIPKGPSTILLCHTNFTNSQTLPIPQSVTIYGLPLK